MFAVIFVSWVCETICTVVVLGARMDTNFIAVLTSLVALAVFSAVVGIVGHTFLALIDQNFVVDIATL